MNNAYVATRRVARVERRIMRGKIYYEHVRTGNERPLEISSYDDAGGIVDVERIGNLAELQTDMRLDGPTVAASTKQSDARAIKLVVRVEHPIGSRSRLDRVRVERSLQALRDNRRFLILELPRNITDIHDDDIARGPASRRNDE